MTRFCGKLTGFNPSGENETTPNLMGPPTTKFGGRPATPAGPLKRFPGGAADISTGNRRLAKTNVSEGGGLNDGVTYHGNTAFGGGKRVGMRTGRKPGGMDGKPSKAMSYNKK
jgi:hypothetical protein